MALTDAQRGFYCILRSYYGLALGKYVLTKIVSYIGAELETNLKEGDENSSADYTIYLDVSYYNCTDILVFLHNHEIAVINITDKSLIVKDKGYPTTTTKSRLNAILSHYNLPTIYSKNYQWYIGDEKWNGTKTFEINK